MVLVRGPAGECLPRILPQRPPRAQQHRHEPCSVRALLLTTGRPADSAEPRRLFWAHSGSTSPPAPRNRPGHVPALIVTTMNVSLEICGSDTALTFFRKWSDHIPKLDFQKNGISRDACIRKRPKHTHTKYIFSRWLKNGERHQLETFSNLSRIYLICSIKISGKTSVKIFKKKSF